MFYIVPNKGLNILAEVTFERTKSYLHSTLVMKIKIYIQYIMIK